MHFNVNSKSRLQRLKRRDFGPHSMDLHKIPKWTGAFCSLFFINVMSSGSMKVCGVFFESMKEMEGLSGSMTGLIFVTPNAVSHLIGKY